ncbi:MAG: MerC domain-containing protein [Planctomycetota bacterium]
MNLPVTTADQPQKVAGEKSSLGGLPDWVGVVASIACAIHCAAMPFVVMALPALGLSFLADESFHKVMVFVCSLLAIAAFVPGFRNHGRKLPLAVGIVGLMLISTAAFAVEDTCCPNCVADGEITELSLVSDPALPPGEVVTCSEGCCIVEATATEIKSEPAEQPVLLAGFSSWITPIGGVFLVIAHLTNHRFNCRCGCCSTT